MYKWFSIVLHNLPYGILSELSYNLLMYIVPAYCSALNKKLKVFILKTLSQSYSNLIVLKMWTIINWKSDAKQRYVGRTVVLVDSPFPKGPVFTVSTKPCKRCMRALWNEIMLIDVKLITHYHSFLWYYLWQKM